MFKIKRTNTRRKWDNIYLFKVNNIDTRIRCKICTNLSMKTKNGVNDVILMYLSLTVNIFHTFF